MSSSFSLSKNVHVLIAYPKVLMGRLIAESLGHNRSIQVAAHVSSADAVIAFTSHTLIDVALIGMSLAGPRDGLEVLRRLREENKNIRAIMLMDDPDPESVVQAFRLGAKGVFSMSSSGYDLLCKCIQCVHDGQIWANAQELHWVMESLREMSLAPSPAANGKQARVLEMQKLSKREKDVVALVAEGLSNRDIARSLNLSENTIKNYLFRIFEKIGVSNRTELLLQTFGVPTRVSVLEPRRDPKFDHTAASRLP